MTSNCGSTVRLVDPARSEEVAEMSVDPTEFADARPAGPIFTMEEFAEDHAAELVRF